jgi:hypothetical protein
MRVFHSLLTASLLMLMQVHTAQAVTATGQGRTPTHIDLSGTIERGGTVNAVDMKKRIIIVDGINFPLTQATLKIHIPTGALADKDFQLKPGMQIRFNTSGHNYSSQMQVYEIWVTSLGGNRTGN